MPETHFLTVTGYTISL